MLMLSATFTGCGKDDISSLEETKWSMLKIVTASDGKTLIFPPHMDDYIIHFHDDVTFNISGGCNYAYGQYAIGQDFITFSMLGPATKMYLFSINRLGRKNPFRTECLDRFQVYTHLHTAYYSW